MTDSQSLPTLRTTHHLTSGQYLTLSLPAGAELFCSSGCVQIQTSPIASLDAVPGGLLLQLYAGQSWRTPQAVHLQLHTRQNSVRLQCNVPRFATAITVPSCSAHNWLAEILRRLARISRSAQPR